MHAEILTIGDELLRGEIVDSNKAFLSNRLLSLDLETRFHVSVRDDTADMRDAFERAAGRSSFVLVSGGLGPTRDDLTSEVLAATFGRRLVRHEPSLVAIRAFFERVGREMAAINEKQALFPEGAEVLENPIGTAPGFGLRVNAATFFALPGVPRELQRMMDEQVLPRIAARRATHGVVRARLLRTFGMGESALDELLHDVANEASGVTLGFRTAFPDNLLRPLARASTALEADARLETVCQSIRSRLGALVYGEGEDGLEAVVVQALRAAGRTLAIAESCTGGLVAQLVTSVPGASEVFRGSVVAYANAAKEALLGVPAGALETHGAVSEPVARTMAEAVRQRFGVDFGLATTGISGPLGGSPEKPVGLVFVALAHAQGTHVERFVFPLDRERHRRLTAQVALDWVRRALAGESLVGPTLMRRRG